MRKALFLSALLFACGGDDNQSADGGQDATTNDVANESSTKDVATNDAKADVAIDAPSEAATDASDAGADVIVDAAADVLGDVVLETSTGGCDGGCTKYSFEFANAQPACQCVGLAGGEKGPVCDAAPANCFVDPCQTKSVQCINDKCVIQ
jgi:hypothetical protein